MYINRYADRLLEENRCLKRQIEIYESEDSIRRINEICENRIRASQDREKRQHEGWMNCLEANKELKNRNTKLNREKESFKNQLKASMRKQERAESDARRETRLRKKAEEQLEQTEARLETAEAENAALKEELCRLKALLDHDGTTNGIPTSQTPRNKKKVIPNSREKSGRARGGQPGHKKHVMDPVNEEVTEYEEHSLEKCPKCGGELEELQEEINKDVSDYEVRVVRKRHKYKVYRCKKCGKTVHEPIPAHLKEKNQYGPAVQAMILALTSQGFVSVGRTKKILDGMLRGKMKPSEGYVGKVQKKAASKLREFRDSVRIHCLKQRILHWDDTVIFMNGARACFRFYGNEKTALYYAHEAKDAVGLAKDAVLQNLTEETYLMHDHLKYNYREEFRFKNIECIAHLERELQRVYNDSGHKWALKMKELISGMIHQRKICMEEGRERFRKEEISHFESGMEQLLEEGKKKCLETEERYFHAEEKNALRKIEEYRENYFAWVYDFTLPTTNNQAESGLRMTKSKMKISGQFGKQETADEFALIRTYTETCRRNGINEFEALVRLTSGNPYTLKEILA